MKLRPTQAIVAAVATCCVAWVARADVSSLGKHGGDAPTQFLTEDKSTLLQFEGFQQGDRQVESMLLPLEDTDIDDGGVVSMLLPLDSGPVSVLLQFEEDDDEDDEPIKSMLLTL